MSGVFRPAYRRPYPRLRWVPPLTITHVFESVVRLQLEGTGIENLTGLQFAVFQQPLPENWTTPYVQGNDASSDENGIVEIAVPGLDAGEIVHVYVGNTDGTVTAHQRAVTPWMVEEVEV